MPFPTRQPASDHGFSQEDIWHAARYWGVSDERALRILIDEEKRFAEDD